MDDVPVTPPGGAAGDSPGDGATSLTALREDAKAGKISIDEYYAACYKALRPSVYRNSRPYLDKDSFEAEDIVQETITKALQRYGKFIDQHVENVGGLLFAIARRLLADHNPRISDPTKEPPLPLDDLWYEDGLGEVESVTDRSDAYDDAATLARARAEATRRLHELAAKAKGPKGCPFHMTSKVGCPKNAQVFKLIGELIKRDIECEGPVADERLRELGRQLGLSSRDNKLRRELTGCFYWWSYEAFRGTAIDQPRGGGDWIRKQLVERMTGAKKADEDKWANSSFPLRGARMILATNPEEFERLFAQIGRADVYEFLTRKAN